MPLSNLAQPTSVPSQRQASADKIVLPSGIAPAVSATISILASKLELESNEGTTIGNSSNEMAAPSTTTTAPERESEPRGDPFDYGATVNALTLQFLNEHEETRVAALEWLLMLHQKAPKLVRIFQISDGAVH